MAFPNPPRTWVTGELVTAALMNSDVRDALTETAPAKVTTAGDLVYATAARTLARLGIGAAGQVLRANSGATAPEWAGGLTQFAETTVGSAVASITFSSIPQTARNLLVRLVGRGTASATSVTVNLELNGSSGDTDAGEILGSGTTAVTQTQLQTPPPNIGKLVAATGTTDNVGIIDLELFDYARSTFRCHWLFRSWSREGTAAADIDVLVGGGERRTLAAVSSFRLFLSSGNFEVGTRATLWGLA